MGPFNPNIIDDQSLLVLKNGAGRLAWNNEKEEYQAFLQSYCLRPSPFDRSSLKSSALIFIVIGTQSSVSGLSLTPYRCWQRCYKQICNLFTVAMSRPVHQVFPIPTCSRSFICIKTYRTSLLSTRSISPLRYRHRKIQTQKDNFRTLSRTTMFVNAV